MALVLDPEKDHSATLLASESADGCEVALSPSEFGLPKRGKASSLWQRRKGVDALSMKISSTEKKASPLSLLVDRYKIMEQLGSGCLSMVHRAVHLDSGRDVALKTLRSKEDGLASVAQQEYELLKDLAPHPHIIQAIDFHNLQGEATLVLEFFEGSTLKSVVRKNRLVEQSVHDIGTALFKAVAHLHENQILHRDIKPENVLVSSSLRDLRLIDFNVAACLKDGPPLTPTGTELYKAPEVSLGEPACERSDVWASCLCLFFALSGRLPQGRDSIDPGRVISEEVALQPVSFDDACWDEVSDECKSLLQRGLAVRHEDRPPIDELLNDAWIWSGAPIMRSLSLMTRVVPGAEAWLSVLPFTCQMCMEALNTEPRR